MPGEFGEQSHEEMGLEQSELKQFETRQSPGGGFEVNLPGNVITDRAGQKFVTSWEIKKFDTEEELDLAIKAAHESLN